LSKSVDVLIAVTVKYACPSFVRIYCVPKKRGAELLQ